MKTDASSGSSSAEIQSYLLNIEYNMGKAKGKRPGFSSDTSFENFLRRCVWCGEYKELIPKKKYCKTCGDKAFRECKRCKRPMGSKYFENDPEKIRCDACFNRLSKERQRRAEKKLETNQGKQYDDLPVATEATTRQHDNPHLKKKALYLAVFPMDEKSELAKHRVLVRLPFEATTDEISSHLPINKSFQKNAHIPQPATSDDFSGVIEKRELDTDLEVETSSIATTVQLTSSDEE